MSNKKYTKRDLTKVKLKCQQENRCGAKAILTFIRKQKFTNEKDSKPCIPGVLGILNNENKELFPNMSFRTFTESKKQINKRVRES